MVENIRKLFQRYDHKEIMLLGLYAIAIVVYILFALVALYMDKMLVCYMKVGIALVLVALLWVYMKERNTSLFAILFMILVELDIAFTMLTDHFLSFMTVYPFIVMFGFFYFFHLRTALVLTAVHYVYWILVMALGFFSVSSNNLIFSPTPIINMFVTSFVILFISIVYYFSTEVTYEKLEMTNEKNKTLLKEMHHRIKNNLNIVASIIGLQINNLGTKKAKEPEEVLQNSKLRIEAIAMIHESLYKNHNMEKVHFKSYIADLTTLINSAYSRNIAVKIESEDIIVPLETMFRLGIIINELFTNSIKYAFTEDMVDDQVRIVLFREKENFTFTYHESRNDHIDIEKISKSKSLGMRLIQLTVKQMHGTLKIARNNGLIITIVFPCDC